jgi:hypothetical protein
VADRGPHARHDRFAIADGIGAGMIPTTIASCPSCGALHADLLAIRAAIRHAWIPARPRDFLLGPDDAVRLRPGPWRRLLAAIGSSRDVVTRPLALSLTGLGLSGLLLTAIPAGTFGGAAGGAAASVTPEVDIAGGPVATMAAEDQRASSPADDDPLAGLSAALLAAGGAIFLLRRVAPRAGGVR